MGNTSLRQISRDAILRFSIILMVSLTFVVSILFAFNSFRSHERQVQAWLNTLPKNVLPHLIDSDHFSITSKAKLIESTRLFNCFLIQDRLNNEIAGFGENCSNELHSITDSTGEVWGAYRYREDLFDVYLVSVLLIGLTLGSVLTVILVFRRRLTATLDSELQLLNEFANRVDEVSAALKSEELLAQNLERQSAGFSFENTMLDRAFKGLLSEIGQRELSIKHLSITAARRESQERLTRIAIQVAHDIRGPLTALKVSVRKLEDRPEIRDLTLSTMERLESISNDLLSSTKSKGEYEESTSLEELISRNVLQCTVRNELTPDSIRLFGTEEHRDVLLKGSLIKFERAFSNILQNAVEASGFGKPIAVRVERNGKFVGLSVIDHGVGIPESIINSITEPGFTHGKANGNGFGLSGARETAEELGGHLSINSIEGQGTQVTIWLPEAIFHISA